MYTLIRSLSVKQLLLEQTPAILTAWLITETFYKFHSFTLECAAFLGTWFVLDVGVQSVRRLAK